jgi:hypothetical protein
METKKQQAAAKEDSQGSATLQKQRGALSGAPLEGLSVRVPGERLLPPAV